MFHSQWNSNLITFQLGRCRKHKLLWSLVKGREVPTTHPGTGLEGATGVRWKVFTGTSREGQGSSPCPAAEPVPGVWRRTPAPRQSQGRWGDGVELHWDPSRKTQLAIKHQTRPFSQASKILRHAYKKGRTPTKQAFRCLYLKLLESEFKERTIVQKEAKVSWIFKRIFYVTSHPHNGH